MRGCFFGGGWSVWVPLFPIQDFGFFASTVNSAGGWGCFVNIRNLLGSFLTGQVGATTVARGNKKKVLEHHDCCSPKSLIRVFALLSRSAGKEQTKKRAKARKPSKTKCFKNDF